MKLLPTALSSALLGLLLLGATPATQAQPLPGGWQQRYGGPAREACAGVFRQPDGTYLFVAQAYKASPELYLFRTTAQGRQLWEKRYTVPGLNKFTIQQVRQNDAGVVMISGYEDQVNSSGLHDSYHLVMLDATGRVLGQRSLANGPDIRYPMGLAAGPGDTFVLGVSSSGSAGAPALLYLNGDGSEIREVPIARNQPNEYLGIQRLFRVPGGTVVALTVMYPNPRQQPQESRLVFYSDQGVRGAETTLPQEWYIEGLLPLGGGEYVAFTPLQMYRFALGSNTMRWSAPATFSATHSMLTPSGDAILYGASSLSHTLRLHLAQINLADGSIRRLESSTREANVQLCASLWASTAALFAEPGKPDSYVIAGTCTGDDDQDIFLAEGKLFDIQVPTANTMQAWPNPVADGQTLNVNAMFAAADDLRLYDLRGKQVRGWAPTDGPGQLHLDGVPAGTYILVGTNGQGKRAQLRIFKK